MKAVSVLCGALAGVALSGWMAFAGEVIEKQTTTTTYSGTVSDISPSSSTIVIKSESSPAPVTYTFNKTTTWVDASGNVITSEQVRNSPVTVHYVKEGDSMVVTKVVASKPSTTKETTTTTTETTKE
ncbi:MAG TPA: hypothetical protein VGC53_10470 [Vicinamibacteria bacterium]